MARISQRIRTKKAFLNFLILINLFVYGLIITVILSGQYLPIPTVSQISQDASNIQKECGGISGSKEQCYAEKFYKFTQINTLEKSTAVLKELQKYDLQSRGCHLISHSISSAETEKDPEKWKDVIAKVSANLCTGGFIHGVLEVVTSHTPDLVIDQSTIPQLCKTIQEKSGDTGEFNCAHIFGHILLADKNGSISQASHICQLLPEKLRYECFSGVYMENMTRDNLVSHGVAKKIPWNDQTTSIQQNLCLKVSQKGQSYSVEANSCWRELAHMYAFTQSSNPLKVYKLCQQAPTPTSKDDCYFHSLGIMTASHQFDDKFISDLCKPYLDDPEKTNKCAGWAIGSMLNSTIEYMDRVVKLCNSLPNGDVLECYRGIGSRLKYIIKDQADRVRICKSVPTRYYENCLGKSF